jgi:hypothetical protein
MPITIASITIERGSRYLYTPARLALKYSTDRMRQRCSGDKRTPIIPLTYASNKANLKNEGGVRKRNQWL